LSLQAGRRRAESPGSAKTFIEFLYLFIPPRLEPLWRSGPYFTSSKSFERRRRQGGARLLRGFWACLLLLGNRMKIRSASMDIIVLGMEILFFVLSLAYIKVCDRI
jgi:hypothetical protein